MAIIDPGNGAYRAEAERYFNGYLSQVVTHTDAGAAFPYHWGAIAHPSNLAFLTLAYAKAPGVGADYAARLVNYGKFQLDYILGDAGRSWMVGFGRNYAQFLDHKQSYYSVLDWRPVMGERIYIGPDDGPWTSDLRENPHKVRGFRGDFWEKGAGRGGCRGGEGPRLLRLARAPESPAGCCVSRSDH